MLKISPKLYNLVGQKSFHAITQPGFKTLTDPFSFIFTEFSSVYMSFSLFSIDYQIKKKLPHSEIFSRSANIFFLLSLSFWTISNLYWFCDESIKDSSLDLYFVALVCICSLTSLFTRLNKNNKKVKMHMIFNLVRVSV